MADATVSQGRREETLPRAAEAAPVAVPRVRAFAIRPLAWLWAGIVGVIGAFLVFGTVRIGAGNWTGLRMSVRRIWSHFVRFLAEQGASAAVITGVTVVAVAALIGSAAVLWLAFAVKDEAGEPLEDSASQ